MIDRHHILFHKREWELRKESKSIRENQLLIPYLDRDVHEELHRECPPVPNLDYFCLQSMRKHFRQGRDTLGTMDNLMKAIEKGVDNNRFHELQIAMAMLSIEAIELQKPYIKEGIVYDID